MVIGTQTMTNSDFLAEVYGDLEPGTHGWVCNFRMDPASSDPGKWAGRPYKGLPQQAALIDRAVQDNTYFCTAVLRATEDGEVVRRKDAFMRLAVLVLDDVQLSDVANFSYAIQTSPGKFQVGIFLDGDDADTHDLGVINRVMSALAARGRSNDASGNACVRYVRLPEGMNTKPRAAGDWKVQLETWNPNIRWSLDDACAAVGIDLDALKAAPISASSTMGAGASGLASHAGEMIAALTDPSPSARVYHDSITRLAASLVSGGMFPGAAVEFMYSLMDEHKPGDLQELARWRERRAEIPRAVKSAEKFAPPERAAPAISVNLAVNGKRTESPAAAEPQSLLIDLQELGARAGTIKWQVKHMIPEDSLGMFFGASGTYKSFVALDHCLHVAHGLPWMGRKTKAGAVVYMAAEGGAGIYRRVQAWHQHKMLALSPRFFVCATPLVLSLEEHVEALASAIEQLPEQPALIYIDTLSQTFDGDENSATDISAYLRLINANIRARFNTTVIVIHHAGHNASERPRGSSAITANVDFMVGVYKPDASTLMARLDVVKQKDGDRLGGLAFKLNRVVLGEDEDGEELTSLAAEHCDLAAQALAGAAQKLSAHEQSLMQALSENGGAMLDKDLRFAFYDLSAKESAAKGKAFVQDTAKKAYARAMQSLMDKQMVAISSAGLVSAVGADTGA